MLLFSSELALICIYKASNKAEYHFHVNTACTYIFNLKSSELSKTPKLNKTWKGHHRSWSGQWGLDTASAIGNSGDRIPVFPLTPPLGAFSLLPLCALITPSLHTHLLRGLLLRVCIVSCILTALLSTKNYLLSWHHDISYLFTVQISEPSVESSIFMSWFISTINDTWACFSN